VIVLILILSASTAMAATETFHETYEVGPETPLTVSNKNGGITINVWDNDFVDVTAEKKTHLGGSLDDVEIHVTTGDTLTIETVYLVKFPRVSVNYTILVPASVIVEEVQTSNGAIRLQGCQGDVAAQTSNGAINIQQHTGDVSAKTSNGSIDVQQITGYVKAKTSNGGISIANVAGIVEAETSNGSISAEVTDIQADEVTLKTSNGRVKVFLAPDLNAELEMKTSNGKITIQDVEIITTEISKTRFEGRIGDGGKKLNVKTSNGSIDVYGLK
jgi:DUF4097 and DUF4098 domain-containing protein YvlB